jgi:hypothetical protein
MQSNNVTINAYYVTKENESKAITKEIESIIEKIMKLSNTDVLEKLEHKIEELEKTKALIESELQGKDV